MDLDWMQFSGNRYWKNNKPYLLAYLLGTMAQYDSEIRTKQRHSVVLAPKWWALKWQRPNVTKPARKNSTAKRLELKFCSSQQISKTASKHRRIRGKYTMISSPVNQSINQYWAAYIVVRWSNVEIQVWRRQETHRNVLITTTTLDLQLNNHNTQTITTSCEEQIRTIIAKASNTYNTRHSNGLFAGDLKG